MTAFTPPTGTAAPPEMAAPMANEPIYSPPGQPAPLDQHNYTPNGAGEYVEHKPGEQAPAHRPQINSHHKMDLAALRKAIAHLRAKAKAGKHSK